jgi:hypothetical protein
LKPRREVSTAEKTKDVNVEKEKRSKKRNERPPSSEEDKTVRVAKKVKTTASRPTKKAASTLKGNVPEPNVNSNTKAQNLPPPSSTIDMTKPISMILPDQTQPTVLLSSSSSSDSSYEDTLTDSSSETLQDIIKKTPKLKPKPKQRTKTPATKEAVFEDNSFLDHLTPHLSGDAFTTSNLNSPNHPINKFLNVTTETEQEPEIHQTSPMITEHEQIPPQTTILNKKLLRISLRYLKRI